MYGFDLISRRNFTHFFSLIARSITISHTFIWINIEFEWQWQANKKMECPFH